MDECFVDIKNMEGSYQVSNLGNIKSLKRTINFNWFGRPHKRNVTERILKPCSNQDGYQSVYLQKKGLKKRNISALAKNFNVSISTIHRVISKKSWTHI